MNLELLATLAIWLMLFPMADICRSSAARFSGGRGRISCPRIAARSNPEIVIPDNDACFFKCSYSFGVIQKSTAFSRFRMVHYSPFRPAAIGGIRGYPLNKPHLCIYKCYACKDTETVSFSIQLKRKLSPGLPSHFYLSPNSFLHLQKIVVILSPDWRRIHHPIIRQLFPEPSGGLASRRIIIQTKMNFFCLPVLL